MLKKNELRNPNSCLNKASADEPVFVLRAKDPMAAQTIRHWVTMSADNQPPEKLGDAQKAAAEFDAWTAKQPKENPRIDVPAMPAPHDAVNPLRRLRD